MSFIGLSPTNQAYLHFRKGSLCPAPFGAAMTVMARNRSVTYKATLVVDHTAIAVDGAQSAGIVCGIGPQFEEICMFLGSKFKLQII